MRENAAWAKQRRYAGGVSCPEEAAAAAAARTAAAVVTAAALNTWQSLFSAIGDGERKELKIKKKEKKGEVSNIAREKDSVKLVFD